MDAGLLGDTDAWFRALHKLEIGPFVSHPRLRSGAIVVLSLCGLVFSLTGVLLAWRRVAGR